MSIVLKLTREHRDCDERLAECERAMACGQWDAITAAWTELAAELQGHFAVEEEVLFPAFEAQSGVTNGPTRVMRMEHDQMRELVAAGHQAIAEQDAETLASLLETLLIMNQQHNLKEENVLYPMCDQVLGADFATHLVRQ